MINTLWQAFRIPFQTRLALTGAGGKSSTLFRLGREHSGLTFLGNTAHLSIEQTRLADFHQVVLQLSDLPTSGSLPGKGIYLFTGADNGRGRWNSIPETALPALHRLADELQIPLLFESDGSRCLPAKAWEDFEPPIPDFVDTVVVCAGLSALGQPLDEAHVCRSARFSQLAELPGGSNLTPDSLVTVLAHPQGGLKNIPTGARRICLLNQADTPELQSQAQEMALQLLKEFDAVVSTAYRQAHPARKTRKTLEPAFSGIHAVYENTAGVVLAAGGASRMGQAKLLLPWRGEPIIRHSVRAALEGGLQPVVVVTGAEADKICAALNGLPIQMVHNPDWQNGQSTSVKTGLNALPAACGGAVFMLADQPHIPPTLVRSLVAQHQRSLAPITAPLIDQQRGNPVLFDRCTFASFMNLQGDAGARQIFSQYALDYLPWFDSNLLLDVDTPEDYQRLNSL